MQRGTVRPCRIHEESFAVGLVGMMSCQINLHSSSSYNMNLFGKAKTAQTTPKDAIIKLRESLEMLEKREKYLEQKIQAELKVAKANATKNKRGRVSNQEGRIM